MRWMVMVAKVWVSRSIKTEADYINAGRRIGPVVGAFTVFATWFGAEAVLGISSRVSQVVGSRLQLRADIRAQSEREAQHRRELEAALATAARRWSAAVA